MPAELDEILAEWRTATGPHIVQGSELRRMAAEVEASQASAARMHRFWDLAKLELSPSQVDAIATKVRALEADDGR